MMSPFIEDEYFAKGSGGRTATTCFYRLAADGWPSLLYVCIVPVMEIAQRVKVH